MALVQCPNCKIQVTEVSLRCFSCGYPMPRQVVIEPPKKRKGFTRAYWLGGFLVVAGYLLHDDYGAVVAGTAIALGVLTLIGSIVGRVFMRWMDKPL